MSFYRNVVWFAKGYQEYTKESFFWTRLRTRSRTCLKINMYIHEKTIKGGYLKKSKNFKPLNRDLTGKTILITGGNSGIGLDAACLLGSLGANVHIACRSKERGEAAVNQIKEKSKETLDF